MRIVAIATLVTLALFVGAGSVGPAGTASANCTVVLDDGSCVNACTVVAGPVSAVTHRPVDCPM